MRENRLCTLDIQDSRERSVSPLGIARCRNFITDLGRRFSRRSHDGVIYTSEIDPEFSPSPGQLRQSRRDEFASNLELCSLPHGRSDSTYSENMVQNVRRGGRRCISVARSGFRNLAFSTKPVYPETAPIDTRNNRKDASNQKKILRQPVSYTYLKGMSGLPTQRVPRSVVCTQYSCSRKLLV